MEKKSDIVSNLDKYFLFLVLLVLIVTLLMFFSSFFTILLIAAMIVAGIFPIHKFFISRWKMPQSLSAFILLILVTVVIVGPFLLFFFLVASEASSAYSLLAEKVNFLTKGDVTLIPKLVKDSAMGHYIGGWIEKISVYAPISTADVMSTVQSFFTQTSKFLLSKTTDILANLSLFMVQMLVFFLAIFYFIRDGRKLVDFIYSMIPLSELYRKELFHKLNQLSSSIIYGLFGGAIAQGVFMGTGFFLVGIQHGLFWGTLTALASIIPYIGTALIWIPAVLWLFITSQWLAGLFLLAWSVLIVSQVDNLVKPMLIGASTALHPLAVLLVILGGVLAFGFQGLLFGPFVLSLALSFIHIYKLEYKTVLGKKDKEKIKAKE